MILTMFATIRSVEDKTFYVVICNDYCQPQAWRKIPF
jgi:hypothetical protein